MDNNVEDVMDEWIWDITSQFELFKLPLQFKQQLPSPQTTLQTPWYRKLEICGYGKV